MWHRTSTQARDTKGHTVGQESLSASAGNVKRYYCGMRIGLELELELRGYRETEGRGSALVHVPPSSCKDKIQLQN